MQKNYNNINMITAGHTNCYVLRGSEGDILIDTGIKKFRDHIEMWLMNYNIKLIILTHGHNDHIQNAKYFSKLYNCKIAMSAYDVNLARDNSIHKLYTFNAIGKTVLRLFKKSFEEKSEKFNVDIFLEDGMSLDTYGINAKIVSLEGHTRGSIGVLYGDDFYIGDALCNAVTPNFRYICESKKAAKKSVIKIKESGAKRLLTGHLDPICIGDNNYKKCFEKWI